MLIHYVRMPHPTHAHMKNGDAQIPCLHRRISHYRVIGDARMGASPISIHWRRVNSERVSDLIPGWGLYGTNTRHASPITKKSKTRIILSRRRFNCWLGSLWH
jgi:hypothetical protein